MSIQKCHQEVVDLAKQFAPINEKHIFFPGFHFRGEFKSNHLQMVIDGRPPLPDTLGQFLFRILSIYQVDGFNSAQDLKTTLEAGCRVMPNPPSVTPRLEYFPADDEQVVLNLFWKE